MSLTIPQSVFESYKVIQVAPNGGAATTMGLAAGTSDVNSSSVDALGFESVAFLITYGDNADTGTFTATIQGSTDDTTFVSLSGPGTTISFTAGASNTDYLMDGLSARVKDGYRHYRVAFDRGTANTTIAALHAFLSGARNRPVVQSTAANQFRAVPTN